MAPVIPIGLKHALESGECVLFLGAGIGAHMTGLNDKPAPDAASLARELATHFGIDTASDNLAKIASIVEIRKDRQSLEDFVRKRFANLQPDLHLRWLLSRRWQAIFTTNYDSCIQRAYELNDKPIQNPVTISSTSELVNYDARLDVPIYHLHGALFGGRTGIVITEDDYLKFRERRRMLFDLLKHKFATSTILYVGYSNRDPNWKLVLDELMEEFLPSTPPISYRVDPNTDPLDIEILKSKKAIETIQASFEEFALVASTTIAGSEVDPDRFEKIRAMVPSQLLGAFEKAPAAVTRLLASWTYVNQAPFTDKPNIDAFLWGDRPNWPLVASKQHFERDIEEDIYDDVLDYVTGNPKSPSVLLALGAAGYGITTLLMSSAVRLIQEGVTMVFMHKPGTALTEGDVLFASSLSAQPTIFFIDDAADYGYGLQGVTAQLRSSNKPAVLVLGERLNEWRQRRARIGGKEYVVDPLSDAEINRLLDCLTRHNALNKLGSLTRDLQFAVIKEKHSKELLVAMKEATEGKGFDAILESEFRGLKDSLAKTVYLTVSCFYQHGAYIRDAVLAKILRIELPELYANTKGTLDGVVMYDCIDEASGTYGARTRHRTVAAIIWERCGESAERDRILQAALSSLNLNYGPDINAFERFIRSDRLVDGLRGLENKIQFFETACRKDPSSPYVRQHYARMLSREKKPELALSQVEEGFKVNEKAPPRVLFHTKGIILTQLALEIENENVARRRLVQAEEAFRKSMTLNPRDEYTYQGLAQLYLGWARRTSTEDAEAAEYVSKAEEIISEGLRNVRERDGLWILTADIQRFLGNTPSHVKALEKAVAVSPGSFIARYLLGRTYRLAGKPQASLSILDPIINGHPDEFRAFIEYALAMLDTGKSLKEAIAVLNISTIYGLSDARFVATLGGMLFMTGEFAEAAKVFQESVRREFPYSEAISVHFHPFEPGTHTPFRLQGKVMFVRPKFTVLEAEGHPTFFCNSTKFAGTPPKVGMPVQFDVEFSAKGPLAVKPILLK